jgi:hypothetical protein
MLLYTQLKRGENMVVIDRRKVGSRYKPVGVLIPRAKVIPADQDKIASENAKLRKKCAEQKENDAAAAVAARQMWAGATIPIEDATHVQTDPEIIREMDAESIRKSAEQQENEVGVMGYAREMIAGPCDDEKGKTLTKKL